MMTSENWIRGLAPLVMAFAIGCSSAYHRYAGCYVDCGYCAPPPLPYVHYEGCVCHSCAAKPYLQEIAADAGSHASRGSLGEPAF